MREDLGRRVVVDEGVEAVGGGVLARKLAADALGERGVGARLVAQAQQTGVHLGPVVAQPVVGLGARGVDERAVGEEEHERVERVVGVVDDATAHPRGVVGQDSAHHRRVDRRGIGSEAIAERRQDPVQVAAHDSRLRPHAATLVENAAGPPVRGELHEDVVGHGLPGQRRAGGPEREAAPMLPRVPEQGAHLVHVLRADHHLRDQPVDRRVDGASEPVQGTREHAPRGEEPAQVPDEDGIGGRQRRVGAQRLGASSPPTGTLNL